MVLTWIFQEYVTGDIILIRVCVYRTHLREASRVNRLGEAPLGGGPLSIAIRAALIQSEPSEVAEVKVLE